MKRKVTLVLAAIVAMIAVALLAMQKKPDLLLLDWAAKADAEKTPVAVLLEMGLKDGKATVWSGHITVNGAKVVHREGYRFHAEDKLTDPDGWKATTPSPARRGRSPRTPNLPPSASSCTWTTSRTAPR